MQLAGLKLSMAVSWVMAVSYDWIKVGTGTEVRVLPYLAAVILAFGVYLCCKENKETTKEEA